MIKQKDSHAFILSIAIFLVIAEQILAVMPQNSQTRMLYQSFFTALLLPGSGLIFLLAGKMVLNHDWENNQGFGQYFVQLLTSFFLPIFLYMLCRSLIEYDGHIFSEDFLRYYVHNVLGNYSTGDCWIIYQLAGLLLAAPLLRRMVQGLETKEWGLLLGVGCLFGGMQAYLPLRYYEISWTFPFVGWTICFLLGYKIDELVGTRKGKKLVLVFGIAAFFLTFLQKMWGVPVESLQRSPLYLCMVCILFLLTDWLSQYLAKLSGLFYWVESHVLGTYLVTGTVLSWVVSRSTVVHYLPYLAGATLFVVLVAMAIAAALDLILVRVVKCLIGNICTPPIDYRRMMWGVGLGTAALIIHCVWYSALMGIFFFLLFCLAGAVRIQPGETRKAWMWTIAWTAVCAFFSCAFPVHMYSDGYVFNIAPKLLFLNFLLAVAVYMLCMVISGRPRSAVVVASLLLLLLSTASAFVEKFRGNELNTLDFYAIGTAMNVAKSYDFSISAPIATCWMLWIGLVFVSYAIPCVSVFLPKWRTRLVAAVLCLLSGSAFWFGSEGIQVKTWENTGTLDQGFLLNFTAGIRNSVIKAPKGYSLKAVDSLETNYSTAKKTHSSTPNIIVIMSESFADFRVFNGRLKTNEEVTPFIDSLKENTIWGSALTPVFGGGTANPEYEFLTGNSLANLPAGAVPYQQYISGDSYSLAYLLKEYGYTSASTHPYSADGWGRYRAYPWIGFEESTFDESYPNAEFLRWTISDEDAYNFILARLDEQTDTPLFLFSITIQNHGSYDFEPFENTITLEGYEGDYPQVEQYLSLLHETDKATEHFLKALEEYPEDTIVLFFGDHMPGIESEFYRELNGGKFLTLPERMKQYTVPFFIWANYDIPEKEVECTSLNYLSTYLLEAAGLELPPYNQFLKEMEQVIPALNPMGYYSKSQQTFLSLDQATGEEAEWLNRYSILQYNNLFDKKNRSELFFGQYLP